MSFPAYTTAAALRDSLKIRCKDDPPPAGAWRAAAAAAGVNGADAFLCLRSRSIAAALELLAASAQAVRAELQSARETVRVEDKSHFDEVEAHIASVESSKRRALELELCAVDAVLEKLRTERGMMEEAAASLGDADLIAESAELMARLDAAEAQLLTLPTSVIEPPHVGLVVDEPALLAGAAVFGQVVAPRAITASDLTLEGAPLCTWPGDTVLRYLELQSAPHASQSAEELEVSLGGTAAATHVEASLKAEGAAPKPLKADVSVDIPERCIVSIAIPDTTSVGSSVCFGPLTVSGQPVAGLLGPLLVEVGGVSNTEAEYLTK